MTEKLYNIAIDAAALIGKETVLDTYCGIGTIGIIAAPHARRVVGVGAIIDHAAVLAQRDAGRGRQKQSVPERHICADRLISFCRFDLL